MEMDRKIKEWIMGVEEDNPFGNYNHSEVEMVEMDHAVVRLSVRPESKNPYNIVHGSAMYLLADEASGAAVHTDGRAYITQSGTLHFLSNQSDGAICADARVLHRGKATVLIALKILGNDNKVLATGEFTYFCIGENEMLKK